MYVGSDFDPVEPDEIDDFAIEVTEDLGAATVASVACVVSIARTLAGAIIDPTPAARLIGAASVVTAVNELTGDVQTFLMQRLGTMAAGNLYIVAMQAVLSDGRTIDRYSHLWCREAA